MVHHIVPKPLPYLIRIPLSAAGVILAAYASFRFVETPLNRLKARYAAK
jgi:peptidoglycan/LPS O-acetylase OafA/YrhL